MPTTRAQVQERTDFLESMRAAGKAGPYEAVITHELRERMMRLEALGVDTGAHGARHRQRAGGAPLPWMLHPERQQQ